MEFSCYRNELLYFCFPCTAANKKCKVIKRAARLIKQFLQKEKSTFLLIETSLCSQHTENAAPETIAALGSAAVA